MNLQDFFENIDRQQQRVKQLPADFQPPKTSPQIRGPYPGRNATRGYLVGESEQEPLAELAGDEMQYATTTAPTATDDPEKLFGVLIYGRFGRQDPWARTAWAALRRELPREYPSEQDAQIKVAEIAEHGGAIVTEKPKAEAERLVQRFQGYGLKSKIIDPKDLTEIAGEGEDRQQFYASEATGDRQFDDMMRQIKKGTRKQATADRRERERQSREQARAAFGPSPADRLSIRPDKGVAEAGYNPLDIERREQQRMDQERAEFKRDELAAELGGEEQRAQTIMSGTWYVIIDGQVWRRQGQPLTFSGRDAARRAGRTIKQRNPGKIVTITTQLPAAKVNEQDYLEAFRATVAEGVTSEDVLSSMKRRLGDYLQDVATAIRKDPDLIDKIPNATDQIGPAVRTMRTDDGHEIRIHGNEDDGFRISVRGRNMESRFSSLEEAEIATEMYMARRRENQAITDDYVQEKSEPNLRKTARTQRMMSQLRAKYPQAESDLEALLYDFRAGQRMDRQDINRLDSELDSDEAEIDRIRRDLDDLMRRRGMTEIEIVEAKKDACYNKVKSRYKVWPSAYASGALVQCRKKGAKNWGTKS